MELTVTHDDGRTEVLPIKIADLIAFERHYGISFYERDAALVEPLLFLAWNATRRAGETREFDDWLKEVADLDEATVPKAKRQTKSRPSP